MRDAIGMLELTSIAKGVEAADFMVKAAEVRLLLGKPVCPGKYVILVHGEVAAVKSSVDAGKNGREEYVVSEMILANPDPQLVESFSMAEPPFPGESIGVLETFSIATGVKAADFMVKAADVVLLELRLGAGVGGKCVVIVSGEVAAVKSSVDAGKDVALADGTLLETVVIPRPAPEIFREAW